MKRLLLNRHSPFVEEHPSKHQAGFRPGKSTTAQLLNLTQHIEDGFQKKKTTGAVFVDLTTAYDTEKPSPPPYKSSRYDKGPSAY